MNRNQMNPGFIGTEERDIAEWKGRGWVKRFEEEYETLGGGGEEDVNYVCFRLCVSLIIP